MCTAIKMNYKDGCVLGRTMDYEVPLNYNILYLLEIIISAGI